jgi:hypothetical protein
MPPIPPAKVVDASPSPGGEAGGRLNRQGTVDSISPPFIQVRSRRGKEADNPSEDPLPTPAGSKSIPGPLLLPGNNKDQRNRRYNPQNLKRKRPGNGYGIERRFSVRSLGDTTYQNQQNPSEVLVSALVHYYQYDAREASSCIPNLLPA